MAFDIGELMGRLRLDSGQFESGIKGAEEKMSGLSGTAGRMRGAMNSIFQGVGMFAGGAAMNGLSAAFNFAKDAVFGFNATIQNSTIAFTTMLGSGQKAQVFLDQLKAFAKSTPFEFEDLVSSAQNMMGMGIAAKDVIPDLTALGDSVASIGGGAEQVKQVTLAFDQMNAKGTVDLGNMNQLMQGGVPNALKIMAEAYHVTTGKMIDMISAGDVQSSVALPALIKGLEQGTKSTAALGGMMDKQSQTFTGALSNISDGLTQAMAGAFKPFFDVASEGAQRLGAFFSSNSFSDFGARLEAGMGGAIKTIKGINFGPVINAFKTLIGIVRNDLIPIGKDIYQTFGPPIKEAFSGAGAAVGPMLGALSGVGGALKSVFGFIDAHKTTFQALAIGILTIVAAQKAWAIATAAWSAITTIATAVQTAFDVAMDANPIGLVVIAILALAAGIFYLWTHSAAFRNFFIDSWNAIWTVLKAIGAWFAGPFANFFVGVWNAISAGALWLWHNVFDPLWQGISSGVAFVMNIVKSFAALWWWFANAIWGPVINGAIIPAIKMFASAALWLWQNVIVPTAQGIGAALRVVGAVASWLWTNAISPSFHGIAAGAMWVWGMLSGAFNLIMGKVRDMGSAFRQIFSAIGGYISSAFGNAVGIVRGAINGIISVVNSAIGGINSVISAANSIPGVSFPHIPSIPHLASGGAVNPTPGGTPVIMGDGGQVEYGIPRSDMQEIINQAVAAGRGEGGGTGAGAFVTLLIKGDGMLAGVRKVVRVQGGDAQTVLVGGQDAF
jgi:tape measure domain-containing protein